MRHHLRVTVALAALAAARILGRGVLRNSPDAGIVNAHDDERFDLAAASQLIRGGIHMPVVPAERRRRVEEAEDALAQLLVLDAAQGEQRLFYLGV